MKPLSVKAISSSKIGIKYVKSFRQTHIFNRGRYNYANPSPDKPKIIWRKVEKLFQTNPQIYQSKVEICETTFCQTRKFIRDVNKMCEISQANPCIQQR
jgi:hypothetical protein